MNDSMPSNVITPPFGSGKILVVDDEPRNLQLVGEILRRDGLKFIFATNGLDALQAVREERPILILLDVMMPGISGFDVCKALKKSDDTKKIPVIFLTATSEWNGAVEGFAAGAVDYVRKPFIREELLARVHTHIELAATQEQLRSLSDQKSELITTLAHDVKNPIAGIVGLTSVLADEFASGEVNRAELSLILKLMENSAVGLLELVDGILDEARGKKLGFGQELPARDVAAVAEHLVMMNALQAQQRSIQIKFVLTSQPKIRVSRRMLTEMFDNLINNAVKYSLPDTQIVVRLKAAQNLSKGFRFEVLDSAPVIAEELQSTLFTKFKMGSQKNIKNVSSHGVGLSIVKRLVNLLDGEVACVPGPDGIGNLFYIEIPILD